MSVIFQPSLQIIRSPCDVINKNDMFYLWEAGVSCEGILITSNFKFTVLFRTNMSDQFLSLC